MAIIIDPISTHDDSGTGNNTVPPGVTGLAWCHCVSTESLLELTTFITVNAVTIGCNPANIRTPALGSVCTYIGLTSDQRDQAIFAGAQPFGAKHVIANDFDSGSTSLYEPV